MNPPDGSGHWGKIMVTVCWAAKGGSGTTVVTALLALTSPNPSLLVDLDGDLPRALGVAEPDRPGVADWMTSDAPPEHLADLVVELGHPRSLLPYRLAGRPPGRGEVVAARLPELLGWLQAWERDHDGRVLVDAGTGEPPTALLAAERSLLVTRNCYLAIERARRTSRPPGGIVLIEEPGRGLGARDVETALGAPVVTRLPWDTGIARAVDMGLLLTRLPRALGRVASIAA